MGIAGLLPLLKPITIENHISSFKNRRVAVDGYSWLHKAVYGCCVELATGKESHQWVLYCMYFIDMLLSFNIQVHMVFDGANLPAKRVTEATRAANRAAALKTGLQLLSSGDPKDLTAARSYLSKATDVTPRMAATLIKILRVTRPSVLCTVAPYEADAQLSYLCASDLVDAVISEDSDTIPYECKEVIYKLKRDGTCETIILSNIYSTALPGLDLRGFSPQMTVALCVGAGCDYLESLKGWGIRNSYKLISKHRSAARMLVALRRSGAPTGAPHPGQDTYDTAFHKAMATFKHQTVFDLHARITRPLVPITRCTLPPCLQLLWDSDSKMRGANPTSSPSLRDPLLLTPPPMGHSGMQNNPRVDNSHLIGSISGDSSNGPGASSSGFSFLGNLLSPALAQAIADGLTDPSSLEPFNLPPVSAQTIALIGIGPLPVELPPSISLPIRRVLCVAEGQDNIAPEQSETRPVRDERCIGSHPRSRSPSLLVCATGLESNLSVLSRVGATVATDITTTSLVRGTVQHPHPQHPLHVHQHLQHPEQQLHRPQQQQQQGHISMRRAVSLPSPSSSSILNKAVSTSSAGYSGWFLTRTDTVYGPASLPGPKSIAPPSFVNDGSGPMTGMGLPDEPIDIPEDTASQTAGVRSSSSSSSSSSSHSSRSSNIDCSSSSTNKNNSSSSSSSSGTCSILHTASSLKPDSFLTTQESLRLLGVRNRQQAMHRIRPASSPSSNTTAPIRPQPRTRPRPGYFICRVGASPSPKGSPDSRETKGIGHANRGDDTEGGVDRSQCPPSPGYRVGRTEQADRGIYYDTQSPSSSYNYKQTCDNAASTSVSVSASIITSLPGKGDGNGLSPKGEGIEEGLGGSGICVGLGRVGMGTRGRGKVDTQLILYEDCLSPPVPILHKVLKRRYSCVGSSAPLHVPHTRSSATRTASPLVQDMSADIGLLADPYPQPLGPDPSGVKQPLGFFSSPQRASKGLSNRRQAHTPNTAHTPYTHMRLRRVYNKEVVTGT